MKKLYDIYRSGNILNLSFLDDETKEKTTERFILKFNDTVLTYDEIYEYYQEEDIHNGEYAMFMISHNADWNDIKTALKKDTVIFFAGETINQIKKKLKPFVAKKKVVDKNLKIIDFEIRGNQMKLYLGAPDCNDYWGDDWNDAPYEHNAGTVYNRYVEDTVTVNFINDTLVEICELYTNSMFSKEDFMKGKPFAFIENEKVDYSPYEIIFDNNEIKKFYFNTPIKDLYKCKYLITD